MVISSSGNAADTVKYDEKRHLFCELTSLTPKLRDLAVGDIKDGWLRIKEDYYYSIEIGGWVISSYGSNDGTDISNNSKTLFIKDYIGLAKLNKKTGRIVMNYSTPDMSQKLRWSCNIGRNEPKNTDM